MFSLVSTIHSTHFKKAMLPNTFGGKVQFNGENWLSTTNQVNINTANFTIECWVKVASNPGVQQGIIGLGNDSNSFAIVYNGSTGFITFETFIGTLTVRSSSVTMPLNQWVHVAVVREPSNLIKIYQNGVNVYTSPTTVTTSFSTGTQGYAIGRQYINLNGNTIRSGGQVTGVRLSNTCRYTSNFTPTTTRMSHSGNDYAVFNFSESATFLSTENVAYSLTNNNSVGFPAVSFVSGYP